MKAGLQRDEPRQMIERQASCRPSAGRSRHRAARIEHVGALRGDLEKVETLALGEAAAAADDEAPVIVATEIDAELHEVGHRQPGRQDRTVEMRRQRIGRDLVALHDDHRRLERRVQVAGIAVVAIRTCFAVTRACGVRNTHRPAACSNPLTRTPPKIPRPLAAAAVARPRHSSALHRAGAPVEHAATIEARARERCHPFTIDELDILALAARSATREVISTMIFGEYAAWSQPSRCASQRIWKRSMRA